MVYDTIYDPKRDLGKSLPGLSVNIGEALKNGYVLGDGAPLEYNMIDDPTLVGNRIESVFDAIDTGVSLQSVTGKVEPVETE